MEFIVAAQEGLTLAAWNPDWDTGVLGLVGSGLKLTALIVVALTLFVGIKHVMGGKLGKAVSVFVGGVIMAAVMWQPSLINSLIDALSGAGSEVVDTVDDLVGGGGAK